MDAVSAEEQDEDLRGLSALLRAHHHGPDGPGAAGRAPRGHHEGLWRLLARKCGLPGTCEEAGRVLLTSTGAWSGQRRRTPLAYMPEPGGGWILVGGNFGRSGRPAWTAHLLKCPDLEFSWGGRDVPVRTVPLTGGGAGGGVARCAGLLAAVRRVPVTGDARDPAVPPRAPLNRQPAPYAAGAAYGGASAAAYRNGCVSGTAHRYASGTVRLSGRVRAVPDAVCRYGRTKDGPVGTRRRQGVPWPVVASYPGAAVARRSPATWRASCP